MELATLGVIGEKSVAQSITGGLVDVSDDFEASHYGSYPDFGQYEIEELEEEEPVEIDTTFLDGERSELIHTELQVISVEEMLYGPENVQLFEPPLPPIAKALNKSWISMSGSIAVQLDNKHPEYTKDPFHGLAITPLRSIDGLRPNPQRGKTLTAITEDQGEVGVRDNGEHGRPVLFLDW